ncbi:MAG: hypothetical protein EP336_01840 [Rhodobacteraceae bacterium]|nr:MAG: hypothetical protein EP336_01840 [Paracoccaceae bacterium]
MVSIQHISTEHVAYEEYFSHTSDIEAVTVDGRIFVLTVGQYDGGASAWELQSGSLVKVDALTLSTGVTAGAEGDLTALNTAAQDYILTGGGVSGAFRLITANGTDIFGSSTSLGTVTAFSSDLYGTSTIQLDTGKILVLGAIAGEAQIGVLQIDTVQKTISAAGTVSFGSNVDNDAIGASLVTEIDGHSYFVAATQVSNTLQVWEIDTATGTLTARASMDADQLFWGTTPSSMAAVEIGGVQYLVVGAYDSSSIHVVQMAADGTLTMVDQVISDSVSHVGNVTAVATIAYEGDTYLAVGGNQGGVALYLMLPDGTLTCVSHIYDSAAMSLQNISDIALYADADGIDIFVSSSSEYGLTHLYVDMSAENGLIAGTDAAETLIGTSLNDVIFDGTGSDVLQGGSGADLFVLAADGETDVIRDFRLGTDRIDLSHWEGLNSLDQLSFVTVPSGIRIHYGDEELILYSHDGYDLYASDFSYEDLFTLDRVALESGENQAAFQLYGTVGNDTIFGTEFVNIIFSDSGDDQIFGYGGNDQIYAGSGDDFIDAGDGDDVIYGEDGADTIYGGLDQDTIYGGGGNDILDGGRERDIIYGGEGDDVIYGFTSHDRLYGEDGNDKLYGSNGLDYMKGGAGNDYLAGARDADSLFGGDGNDQLRGGSGEDKLRGEGGNDLLYGQDDRDAFIFSDDFGRDTIYDFEVTLVEIIDLSDVSEITSWEDLVANHLTETAGGSAQIYLDENNIITISGVGMEELTSDMFVF